MLDKMVEVHISEIMVGDVVVIDGLQYTVGKNNIKYDSFMGHSLFGDNYRSGTIPVKKMLPVRWYKGVRIQ